MIDKVENCCGCSACFNACKKQAIIMESNDEGFLFPVIDKSKCINCGKCEKACPIQNHPKVNKNKKAYACYADSFNKRMKSCSGAVFTLLAEKMLEQNGVVYGAAFDDRLNVYHLKVDSVDDLKTIKGSKYVQSIIGITYSEIEDSLKIGKTVLFSGTPCQVSGLLSFLGKEYENLFCVDVICHGVPSPMVWAKYLDELSPNVRVVNMSFRNKTNGIKNKTLDYYLADGSVISEKYEESAYIKGFIQDMYLRPSCYQCEFKGINRCSDITIGDFWGLQNFYPKFGDDYGVSAVIVHSSKGEKYFESIKNDMHLISVTSKQIAAGNDSLLLSAKTNNRRNEFFERLSRNESMSDIINSLYDPGFWENKKHPTTNKLLLKRVKSFLIRN